MKKIIKNEIIESLKKAVICTTNKTNNLVLESVNVKKENNTLHICSTNGVILFYQKVEYNNEIQDFNLNLFAEDLNQLKKDKDFNCNFEVITEKIPNPNYMRQVKISKYSNSLHVPLQNKIEFLYPKHLMINDKKIRILEEIFPNYNSIMPCHFEKQITVKCKYFNNYLVKNLVQMKKDWKEKKLTLTKILYCYFEKVNVDNLNKITTNVNSLDLYFNAYNKPMQVCYNNTKILIMPCVKYNQ